MVRERPGTSMVVYVTRLEKEVLGNARLAFIIDKLDKMASFRLRYSVFGGKYVASGTSATPSAWDNLVAPVSGWSRVVLQISIQNRPCMSFQQKILNFVVKLLK